jgi:hypothetical protein
VTSRVQNNLSNHSSLRGSDLMTSRKKLTTSFRSIPSFIYIQDFASPEPNSVILKTEAARSSETSKRTYDPTNTQRNITGATSAMKAWKLIKQFTFEVALANVSSYVITVTVRRGSLGLRFVLPVSRKLQCPLEAFKYLASSENSHLHHGSRPIVTVMDVSCTMSGFRWSNKSY